MTKLKMTGVAAAVALVLVAIGYLWGALGRWDVEARAGDLELRVAVAHAAVALLEGRVDLYNLNFGSAARQFEAAKQPASAAADLLERQGRGEAAAAMRAVLPRIEAARAAAAALDQGAGSEAAAALAAIRSAADIR